LSILNGVLPIRSHSLMSPSITYINVLIVSRRLKV
jgi:hypothetical protein